MLWRNSYKIPGKGDSGIGQFFPLNGCCCVCPAERQHAGRDAGEGKEG